MKTIKSMILLIGLLGITTMSVPAKPHSIGSSKMHSAPVQEGSIVGSWEIEGDPVLQPNTFKALGTFMRDGGYITSAHEDFSFGGTPGYGAWKKLAKQQYALTFKQLMGGADGSFQGTLKVNAELTLSVPGNHFEGTFVIYIFAPDGTLVFTDTGTVTGTRIEVLE